MRLPRLLAGFVGNCGVALARERARSSNSIRWSCAARPHNSRGTSVYRHRSRASFRYVCRSLSFHVFVISILTLLPSHFFRAITCSVSLFKFTRCKSKERKKRRKRDIKRKFHKREFFHPFANN